MMAQIAAYWKPPPGLARPRKKSRLFVVIGQGGKDKMREQSLTEPRAAFYLAKRVPRFTAGWDPRLPPHPH
jgi:hypothetical protein